MAPDEASGRQADGRIELLSPSGSGHGDGPVLAAGFQEPEAVATKLHEALETARQELAATIEELELANNELVGTSEDLEALTAELRQRSAEVDEVNALLGSVLDGLDQAVVVVDTDLRIRCWNRRAHGLWGLKPEEAMTRSLLALDVGLPVDRLAEPLRSTLADRGDDETFTVESLDRRSRPVPCEVRCRALRSIDGEIDGAVIIMTVGPTEAP